MTDTPVHKSIRVRIDQILVDDTRNVRNFGRPIDPNDPETIKLVKLIERDGQLKPVSVVAYDEGIRESYILDTGFRRMCAMRLLKFQDVSAVVVDGDEEEAARIARVVGENEGHKALSPAELAFACWRLRETARDGGPPMTSKKIADLVGRSPSYCDELLNCYDHLIPPILAAWKGEGRIPLPVSEAIRFAHMGKPKQEEEWKKFLATDPATISLGGKRGKKRAGGPRPCPRADVEMLREQARTMTVVLIDGRYEPVKGRKELRLVRAAVSATLAHVLDKDSALPFKRKGA